jgi:hypothetical protein
MNPECSWIWIHENRVAPQGQKIGDSAQSSYRVVQVLEDMVQHNEIVALKRQCELAKVPFVDHTVR